jgi:hypothetical protein
VSPAFARLSRVQGNSFPAFTGSERTIRRSWLSLISWLTLRAGRSVAVAASIAVASNTRQGGLAAEQAAFEKHQDDSQQDADSESDCKPLEQHPASNKPA